ncbi:hypothetical protein TNCV_4878721 [Trichonephila clavipes]|nr:hypothetical protein TNCV_4878721 [Trichonephila clavipes]
MKSPGWGNSPAFNVVRGRSVAFRKIKSIFVYRCVRDEMNVFHKQQKVMNEIKKVLSSCMMKSLGQTESGSTESNESVPSTSQQHLSISESPLNLEVTPNAQSIDT